MLLKKCLSKFYGVLDSATIYRLASYIFSPGGKIVNRRAVKNILRQLPSVETMLDVGCGPASRLFEFGYYPIGIDISPEYIREYKQKSPAFVGSAAAFAITDSSIGGIWSTGMFHHLSDDIARKSIIEMIRVCQPGGYVVIFDAVLPRSPVLRPLAALVRFLDRGKYMRTQDELEDLLPGRDMWEIKRYTYALTGLEMLQCVFRNNP